MEIKAMAERKISLPPLLCVNNIVIYDFCDSAANVIHPSNPLHLVICFESFCHTLKHCHLFYSPKNTLFSCHSKKPNFISAMFGVKLTHKF